MRTAGAAAAGRQGSSHSSGSNARQYKPCSDGGRLIGSLRNADTAAVQRLGVLAARELEITARMTSFFLLMSPRLLRRTTPAPASARMSMSGTSQVRAILATCMLQREADWLCVPGAAGGC